MNMNRDNIPYYDGRDMDKVAKRMTETQKQYKTTVIKPENVSIPNHFYPRYQNPYELNN